MTPQRSRRLELFPTFISRPVAHALRAGRLTARVLAAFKSACDLVTDTGDVIALVTPEIGNGPLNVVLDAPPGAWDGVTPHRPVEIDNGLIHVGCVTVDLRGAAVWEPCPEWAQFTTHHGKIRANVAYLAHWLGQNRSPGGLITLLYPQPPTCSTETVLLDTARPAANALAAAIASGDGARAGRAASRLAGLGSGLTPSGDDFLIGVMAWLWLDAPSPPAQPAMCAVITQAAITRTTVLSSALLRAAGRGEFSEIWHNLFKALANDPCQVEHAARQILAYGHTSGADALTGFTMAASIEARG